MVCSEAGIWEGRKQMLLLLSSIYLQDTSVVEIFEIEIVPRLQLKYVGIMK